jgi:hypothetical protein
VLDFSGIFLESGLGAAGGDSAGIPGSGSACLH